jgi:hypothetical protein
MLQGLIELEIWEKTPSYEDCYIAINYSNGVYTRYKCTVLHKICIIYN